MVGLAIGILLLPLNAKADVAIIPIAMLSGFAPLMALSTAGLSLVAVIAIEAVVLRHREELDYRTSIKLSTLANLLSTFLGFVTMALSSSGEMFLVVMPFVMVAISGWKKENTGIDLGHWMVRYFGSLAFCFSAVHLAVLTVPGGVLRPLSDFPSPQDFHKATLAAAGLVVYGFILSVLSEGWLIGRNLRRSSVFLTVVLMNLASYAFLGIVSVPHVRRAFINRSWYWHYPDFKDPYQHDVNDTRATFPR